MAKIKNAESLMFLVAMLLFVLLLSCGSTEEDAKLKAVSEETEAQARADSESVFQSKSAEDVMTDYLELAKVLALEQMYDFYSTDSKMEMDKQEFLESMSGVIDYEIDSAGFHGDTAWVEYRVRRTLMVVMDVRRRLIRQDGEWRILKGRETIWTSSPDKYRSTDTREP